MSMNIKKTEVLLKNKVKILNIIISSGLRFKNYIKKIIDKELRAILALKYISILISLTTRQLFNIIIILIIDYVSSV